MALILGDPLYLETLTPHQLLKLVETKTYFSKTPEEREEERQEEEFNKWAKGIKSKGPWVPKVTELGETIKK